MHQKWQERLHHGQLWWLITAQRRGVESGLAAAMSQGPGPLLGPEKEKALTLAHQGFHEVVPERCAHEQSQHC